MKPLHLVWILPLAAALSAGAARWVWSASAPGPAVSHAQPGSEGLLDELAALRSRQAELERRIEELRLRRVLADGGGARAPVLDLEAELERWWARRGSAGDSAASTAPPAASTGAPGPMAELLDPRLDAAERTARLQELRKSGGLDELIADLQGHLRMQPGDAGANLLLAQACIQRIQAGDLGAEAGDLATLADRAFDNALSVDPGNWEARYSKAEALSYWPTAAGKSQEAIAQLEILLQQQAAGVAHPGHAKTHLLLGNLYMNAGHKQMALTIWQQGLAAFPSNGHLQQQLSAHSKP
jgi:tetratricopeptide (TPR) repeat protein